MPTSLRGFVLQRRAVGLDGETFRASINANLSVVFRGAKHVVSFVQSGWAVVRRAVGGLGHESGGWVIEPKRARLPVAGAAISAVGRPTGP